MNFIKALAVSLALAMFSVPAFAKAANVSWVNATQNTDGTPIPATGDEALKHTEIQWGLCDAAGLFPATPAGSHIVLEPTIADLVSGLNAGTWCFRARHQNFGGVNSNFSATVQKIITIGKPKPPVISVL